MSSKKPATKKKGLSGWEKAGIPVIIIIVIWAAYSLVQPSLPVQQTTTTMFTSTSGATSTSIPYAPDFTLPVIGPNGPTGGSISLSSLRGRAVVLEFMEPWCPHCQSMVPVLDQLHDNYGNNVTFVSVGGPWNGATQDDLAAFQRNYGAHWTYAYDSSGSVMSLYGVNSTPTFFIITRSGVIVTTLQGDQAYASLQNIIIQAMQS
ncbi:MAG TPA: TlpA disulfide reductase family protein [Terriglobales bacterium]|nr:TlpA disulfide reductase family protein [Terriglobales bacterium]